MPYSPGKPPAVSSQDAQAIAAYLADELQVLASALRGTDSTAYSVSNAAPVRPRTGTVVYADGTNWNPGSGEGLYAYNAAGSWVYLEVPSGTTTIDTATGAFTISGLLSRSSQDLRVLAATKADQQAGTSAILAVTPSQQQSHPSAAKAWGLVTVSAGVSTLVAGYNVASVAHTATGTTLITFTTAFASTSYGAVITTASPQVVGTFNAGSTSTMSVLTRNQSGFTDLDQTFFFIAFGTQ